MNDLHTPDIATELAAGIGAAAVAAGADMQPHHFADWVVHPPADMHPIAVAYPASTDDVATILRICNARGVPVVPQGGLTGLAGGGAPVAGCVALSLARMRAIEEIDPAAATITVQAGVPLAAVQDAADDAGLLFPLDIGSRGSCLIGGNLSTNAGGNRVLRYGMARGLVLGLEAVLADGTVITSLNKMLKNNAGYDLKQLFIGSEGTLGVITRAVLRLFPKPASVCTAFLALPSYTAVLDMLRRAQSELGGTLSAFEVIWPEFYTLATTEHNVRTPLPRGHAIYILIECLGADQARDTAQFQSLIEAALEAGTVEDAAIAQSGRDSRDMWALRDSVAEFNRTFPHVGFDVAIPIAAMQDFITDCQAHLAATDPGFKWLCFGHIADSNIHLCVQQSEAGGLTKADIDRIVYARVRAFAGSVSAEHGIGSLKKTYLGHSRTPAEIALMQRLKSALDPNHILNPGKIF